MPPIVLDHIAIGAHRLSDAPGFLAGELGGEPVFGGPADEYRYWTWQYPGGARLEVLEPDGPPDGFLHRFLERNGPGIHHVTFHVTELDDLCARAQAAGHSLIEGPESADYREVFLHPKTAMGVVVQLTAAHDHDDPNGSPPGVEPPPSPEPASPAARTIGLRMRTGDRDRALRQWGELLGGRVETQTDSELTFHWPESAMRVRVLIDPQSPDRSEAIEIAEPPRPVSPPPHPLLGARVETVDAPR